MIMKALTFIAGAGEIVGQSVLNETMKTAISQAIANLTETTAKKLMPDNY